MATSFYTTGRRWDTEGAVSGDLERALAKVLGFDESLDGEHAENCTAIDHVVGGRTRRVDGLSRHWYRRDGGSMPRNSLSAVVTLTILLASCGGSKNGTGNGDDGGLGDANPGP